MIRQLSLYIYCYDWNVNHDAFILYFPFISMLKDFEYKTMQAVGIVYSKNYTPYCLPALTFTRVIYIKYYAQ